MISKRLFIVGTARSGTTLVQGMLANHPRLYAFPESHLFMKTIPLRPIKRHLFWITSANQDFVRRFLRNIKKEDLYRPYQGPPWNMKMWIGYLVSLLDKVALDEGKEGWIEKTPIHLRYAKEIKNSATDAFFIYTRRAPISNIASLLSISRKHPGAFKQVTVRKALKRFLQDHRYISSLEKHRDSFGIQYEDLVADPERILKELCSSSGLDYHQELLNHGEFIDQISYKSEVWKARNRLPLVVENRIHERLTRAEFDFVKLKLNRNKIATSETYPNEWGDDKPS